MRPFKEFDVATVPFYRFYFPVFIQRYGIDFFCAFHSNNAISNLVIYITTQDAIHTNGELQSAYMYKLTSNESIPMKRLKKNKLKMPDGSQLFQILPFEHFNFRAWFLGKKLRHSST